MDISAIAAVQATSGPGSAQSLQPADPVGVNLQQALAASKPGATAGASSAFADLRAPEVTRTHNVQSDWVGLTRSVMDGSNKGLLQPRIQELEKTLKVAADNPSSVSSEQIAVMMLKVSEASAVTNVLSTSVNAVRKSVATLVERTG